MSKSYKTAKGAKTPTQYKDHDIAGTDPNKNQFAPTEANPIRQHVLMAGDPAGGLLDKVKQFVGGKGKPAKEPTKEAPPKEDTTKRREYLDKAIEG